MANVASAQLIESDKEVGALFRVHETPADERLNNFRSFLGELGLNLEGGDEPSPKDYATLLEQVKERQDHELIETMLLRSMQQAVYQAENKGHFGLALKSYAHFTSPIRRYPDLILHRAIKAILRKKKGDEKGLVGAWAYSDKQLDELGVHTSMTERRADDATRQVDEWLKCEFMLDHVGMEFEGVISSVTNFGLFVRLSDYQIDGLIHISNLDNDYYHFDQQKGMLVGENSNSVFRLGDNVKVKVKDVNLDDRKIDLTLLEATSPGGQKRNMPAKGSGKGKKKGQSRGKGGQRKSGNRGSNKGRSKS